MASFLQDPTFSSVLDQIKKTGASAGQSGASLTAAGSDALGPVLAYFKSLASGNPQAIATATAPARRRVIDQYDTARKTISQFSPRGGGSNAVLVGSQFGEANELSDIGANAQTHATDALASLGTQEQGLGLSADQIQSQSLSNLLSAILGGKQIDEAHHAANMSLIGDIFDGVGTLVGLGLTHGARA